MLDHLGWSALFRAVHCLDEHPDCPGKPQLLAKVIVAHALRATGTPYVGDTEGDALSARANAMPYIHVAWGYGDLPETTGAPICTDPAQLPSMIDAATRELP
jgi:phosphoglycolate phosphatase-like HAD superfamily hydrolase